MGHVYYRRFINLSIAGFHEDLQPELSDARRKSWWPTMLPKTESSLNYGCLNPALTHVLERGN